MTKIIGLLVLLFTFSANAGSLSIQVDQYLETDFDFMFEIVDESNQQLSKVVLDCQSFINGVNLYGPTGEHEILILDIGECEDIHEKIFIAKSNDKPACLKLDFDMRAYRVTPKKCD